MLVKNVSKHEDLFLVLVVQMMKRVFLIILVAFCFLFHCYSQDKDTSVIVMDVPPQLNSGYIKHLCYIACEESFSALTIETSVYKETGWSLELNSNLWMYSEEDYANRILTLTSDQKIEFLKNALNILSNKIDLSSECIIRFLNSDFPEWSIDWSREPKVRKLMNSVYNNSFTNHFKDLLQKSELFKRLFYTFTESGYTISNLEVSHIYTIDKLSFDDRFKKVLSGYDLQQDDILINCDISFNFSKRPNSQIHSDEE